MPCSLLHFTHKTPSPSQSLTFPTHNAKTLLSSERHKCRQTLCCHQIFFPLHVCLWFGSLAFNIVTFKFNPPLVISQAPPPLAKNRSRVIKTGKSNQTCFLRLRTLADEVPSSRMGCNIATISLCVRRQRHARVLTFTSSRTVAKQTHTGTTMLINPHIFSHTGYPCLSSRPQLD